MIDRDLYEFWAYVRAVLILVFLMLPLLAARLCTRDGSQAQDSIDGAGARLLWWLLRPWMADDGTIRREPYQLEMPVP